MLTGAEIIKRVEDGRIVISDFDEKRINPNSYNLRLGNILRIYNMTGMEYLDSKKNNPTKEIIIPETGYILQPGILYLGYTREYTYAEDLIPNIDGRSSVGRLGIEVHRTAGFGDIGFKGKWTLEITAIHPVKIYPNQEICQIYYEEPTGDTNIKYNGRYQNQDGPIASRFFETGGDVD